MEERSEAGGSSSRSSPRDQRADKCLDLFFGSKAGALGPLGVLEKAMRTGQKVMVVTRHKSGIRGVCLGLVAAFDKHFNLVLRDVDERYTVLHKVAPEGEKETDRWKKKLKYYRRHVPQMLLRGEGIVLVSLGGENAGAKYFSRAETQMEQAQK
ncbi:hypothetical protein HOP50_01g07910 [Chloropicon primus]|nr:hypothetical protein HOP50_01g07910 [Chloropicon primus]|mmetsp:Transcript_5307/g.16010  ORF Transcript_5307/g.16010 Transcript_5307/m.16010 type:complete len:154 (-) Transcript_5307:350-811(-)